MADPSPNQRPWLLLQWDDIKGNAKFALLITIGATVVDWIRNGSGLLIYSIFAVLAASLFCLLMGAGRIYKWIGYSLLVIGLVTSLAGIISHESSRISKEIGRLDSRINSKSLTNSVVADLSQSSNAVLKNNSENNSYSFSAPNNNGVIANLQNSPGASVSLTNPPPSPTIAKKTSLSLNILTNGMFQSQFDFLVAYPAPHMTFRLLPVPNTHWRGTNQFITDHVYIEPDGRVVPYQEFLLTVYTSNRLVNFEISLQP
jgi:hypothetical protein